MNDYNLWEKVTLPPELLARLREMIRRVRLLQLARGVAATLGVALAAILVVMGVDAAVVIYSDAVRWCLSLAGLALTLLTAYIALWRPLADRLTPVRMARIVETRHPELQERISSALELLGAGGGAAAEGSGQLLEILATAAAADVAGVSARTEFRGATLRPVLISAAAVFVLYVVLLAVWPRQTILLFARAVAPGAPLANLAARTLTVEPCNLVRVAGESIRFTLTAPGERGSRAELLVERPGQPLSVERLTRRFGLDDDVARFELELPAVRSSFRYRMRLGNALTRRYAITIVPPPAYGDLEYRLDYPAYIGLAPTQFTSRAVAPLALPVGTRAGLRAALNRRMEAALVFGGRRVAPVERLPADAVTFDWLAEPERGPARWTLALRDERGFTNVLDWASYETIPDFAPHVQLTYPTGNAYTLPTFGLLKLVYALSDDHGLSETRLAILPDNDKTPWYLDLDPVADEEAEKAWTVAHDLSLAEFQLGGARKLRIWLEVSDNLPPHLGGPNVSKSRVVAVNLDNGQKRSLADQVRIPQREALTNLLESAARRLEEASRRIAAVTNQTDEALFEKAVEEAEKVAAEASADASAAAAKAEKSLFAGVSEEVRDVAEESVSAAVEATAEIAAAEEPDERRRLAEEALEALASAAEETRALVPEVLAKDQVLEEAAALEAAAVEQARQAEKAMERQLTDDEMTAWQEKQEELAERIEAYDLRNEITDTEQVYAGETFPEPPAVPTDQPPAVPTDQPLPVATDQPTNGSTDQPTNGSTDQPINGSTDQPANGPTDQPANGPTDKPSSAAAEAARAAAAAAETAKAVDVDENKLKMARQAEAAAKESRRAATEARRAADVLASVARDREALEAIRDEAEKTARDAAALADEALQVRLEAVREVAEAIPPDVAKAMDLAQRAEKLANLADEALKAAGEGRPVSPEALAAQAAALRQEAEELARQAADNPFLKASAERAAEVARRAEEAVAGLRAAAREGADADTVRQGLEKAAAGAEKAAEAADHAADEAARAAQDVQKNAVQAADEAAALVAEAEKLHEELQQTIAAARDALSSDGAAQPAPDTPAPQGDGAAADAPEAAAQKDGEAAAQALPALAADAEKLVAAAEEAVRHANAAEAAARRQQAALSAETAQRARQAADSARRSAEAAKQAVQAERAGQKPQADQRLAEAKRLAGEGAHASEAVRANAEMLAAPAAEHARKAADAAKEAAALAEEAARRAGEGLPAAEKPASATTSADPALAGLASDELKSRLADAVKAAREAAFATEKVAADRRENLPVEAARVARQAADQADAARQALEPPPGAPPQPAADAVRRAGDAAAGAEAAAATADRLARRAASRPDEQVAELANEGRLAAKALDHVADKIADAAQLAQKGAEEKAAAAGDAEKVAAADSKAEEARRLFADARQEARSIGQGLQQLANEMRPVLANAERVAREEASALARRGETPDTLPETLPGQVALQGAREMQRLFDENRRAASDLENIANAAQGNPAAFAPRAENVAQRVAALADRAEQIAASPGIRQHAAAPEGPESAGQPAAPEGPQSAGQPAAPEASQSAGQPAAPETPQSAGQPTREIAALAEQLASARQQTAEVRAAVEAAGQTLAAASAPAAAAPAAPSGEAPQEDGEAPQGDPAAMADAPREAGASASGRPSAALASDAGARAAAAEGAARTAAASAARTAARATGSVTNRENRAAALLAASEKASQTAAASAAKLAESVGRLAAEEAMRAAEAPAEGKKAGKGDAETMMGLVSQISGAAGKAAAARKQAEEQLPDNAADSSPENAADSSPDSGDGRTAFGQSLADQAAAEADEAIRQAKLLQEPTPEQIAAAREAYKAALAMRKLAQERAETAGLDTATMKARQQDGGRKRGRDPDKAKKPAPTELPGRGGGQHDADADDEAEYEDGLALEMPEWLRLLGFPRDEWLKYKGSLESGLPDGALDKVAPEYRDLVRRYFELLSKEK